MIINSIWGCIIIINYLIWGRIIIINENCFAINNRYFGSVIICGPHPVIFFYYYYVPYL